MANASTTRITLSYEEDSNEITKIYAVSQETLREAKNWVQQQAAPSWGALTDWLNDHGGQLDCQDGPAFIKHLADGSTYEEYWRNGYRSRQNGPAVIMRDVDGSAYEEYWRNGQRDRQDGPAYIWRKDDGVIIERFYENGRFIREDRLPPLPAISGVTVKIDAPAP